MKNLPKEKEHAIQLRKQGKTYGEIAKKIKIAKSTLSLWLRKVEVSAEFITRLRQKKLDAVRLGWAARRKERIDRTQRVTVSARKEVKQLMRDPLWLVGVTLYWAEGHKEKLWRPGALVTFTNMDENTIVLFMGWCRQFLSVARDGFICSLYIHDSHKARATEVQKWWGWQLSIFNKSQKYHSIL